MAKQSKAKTQEASPKPRIDTRQEVTDRMIEAIQAGTAPWMKGWESGHRDISLPYNAHTGKRYQGGNILRLLIESRSDPRWAAFGQIQKEGWKVRAGEHGTKIEFYGTATAHDSTSQENDKTTRTGDNDGKTNEKDRQYAFVKTITVFNAEQIEGIPPFERRTEKENNWDTVAIGDKIIEKSKADIRYEGSQPLYRPTTDVIYLPKRDNFINAEEFYATAFHELAHWSGHPSRLNRPLTGSMKSSNLESRQSYAREELRAEIASMFVMLESGIGKKIENHAAYVDSWISLLKQDKNEIFIASREAQKIADLLIEPVRELIFEKQQKQEQFLDNTESLNLSSSGLHDLPVYVPRNSIPLMSEKMNGSDRSMIVLGKTEDGERVLGRYGSRIMSVSVQSFTSSPKIHDEVSIIRIAGIEQAKIRESRQLSLGF